MARRWTIEEENKKRDELVALYINKNKTIGEIGRILGIAQTTVFDRMERLNIPTSPEKKEKFLNKKEGINFPIFSNKLAEFFGIMLGDGHLSSGQLWIFIYNKTDGEYVPYVKNLIKLLFKVEAKVNYRRDQDMMNVFLSSVEIIKYLKEKGLFSNNKVRDQVNVPKWIFNKKSFQKSFLRGFFDTDGSIYKLKFGIQMGFSNKSLPLLESTREMLRELGYSPSKISSYKVYITKRSDLLRYANEIGFGNIKHADRARMFGLIG